MAAAIISMRHVSKKYGSRTIFRDVCLDLPPASLTLIIGPNGAGKSTLLRLLAGLSRPDSGEIIMDDDAPTAYLGHATFIYPDLSAIENLAFWTKAHGMDASQNRLLEILKKMNLQAHAFEPARIFSRGMAQRLNFARILCLGPGLLLLDEPFTGLDLKSSGLMRREIASLRDAGAAIALVSHALDSDMELADHILAFGGGKAILYPTPEDFRNREKGKCPSPC